MPLSTISSTIDSEINDPEIAGTTAIDLPARWTPDHVAVRLVDAFRTLDRLPRPKGPRAAGNHWPRHRVEWADQVAQAELPEAERREREARRNALAFRPSGVEIARMDVMLERLRGLREHEPQLALITSFWAFRAARRRSIRAICRELGLQSSSFYYQRGVALAFLADRFNADAVAVF